MFLKAHIFQCVLFFVLSRDVKKVNMFLSLMIKTYLKMVNAFCFV